ncbi:MAG: YaiI/YqxD family protein [Melioribacteraceae bacterium]|nr:YaiI/YqxD family protein [Melioribacteraceae bacterium]
MKFYIDGDAFPNLLKPIIFRAIEKYAIPTLVISNKRISIGNSKNVEYVIVSAGPDEADNRIVEMVCGGDLVITSDIPLADQVIEKNAFVINHSGKFYNEDNIKQALAIRDLMQSIRDSGEQTKGPAPLNEKNVREFANKLNQFLNRRNK